MSMPKPSVPVKKFNVVGAVDPAFDVYLQRVEDTESLTLLREGTPVNIHAGRQSGKTTLLKNLRDTLRQEGHICLEADFSLFVQEQSFAVGLAQMLASFQETLPNLHLSNELLSEEKPGVMIQGFLEYLALQAPPEHRIYLFLDEADSLLRFPSGEVADFFIALRHFFQSREERCLVLALISVLTPTEMLMNHPMGGVSIAFFADILLQPFANTPALRLEIARQAFPCDSPEQVDGLLEKLLRWSGGQPYITCALGAELQNAQDRQAKFLEMEQQLLSDPGRHSRLRNHFQGMRKQLLDQGNNLYLLLNAYRQILMKTLPPGQVGERVAGLENIGLVMRGKNGVLEPANPLYKAVFTPAWVTALEQEFEHQSRANLVRPVGAGTASERRICLIMCGGTIGMITPEGKSEFRGAQSRIQAFVDQNLKQIAEVHVRFLWEKDGINITPEIWKELAAFIFQFREQFDGFVVAHGTDTMVFTASAVAFMLGPALDFPVVFTGSQATFDISHGDARVNLERACMIASHPTPILEVQILFGDLVLRAVRAVKTDDRTFDGFQSPAWPPLARVTEKLLINHYALRTGVQPIGYAAGFRPFLASNVLPITLYPGVRPDLFQAVLNRTSPEGHDISGVIIFTPGAGNIPNEPGYNFHAFIRVVIDRGIPVLIASQIPMNSSIQAQYEMASAPVVYGAIPAGNLTPPAAYTKFAWVLGCMAEENQHKTNLPRNPMRQIKTRMETNYLGEEGEYAEQVRSGR